MQVFYSCALCHKLWHCTRMKSWHPGSVWPHTLFRLNLAPLWSTIEHKYSILIKPSDSTWINPCPMCNVTMCTLIEKRIVQVCVFVDYVAKKRFELGPDDLSISIWSRGRTPVEVPFTGLHPCLEILIPLLLDNLWEYFGDLYRN